MIRLFFYIALVLALGFGFAWLADRPGEMTIAWQGREIQMSLMVAVAIIVSLVALILLVWWVVRLILTSPYALQRHFRARKRDRGYQALSTGLIAAGAGDAVTAHKMTKRTRGLINADQEPLIHLLEVQTALIEGRNDDARKMFETLTDDPETEVLGLRGLYLEARRQGADEAARHYAERAAEKAPQLPWAGEAALSNRTAERKWDDALALLERQKQAGMYDKGDADRKKAVLLTARAMDRLDADPSAARADGTAALKLAPNFVPAVLVAAKACFREDRLRKGAKLLELAWREHQHPDIAETYVRARIGDSPADELKRAQKLETIRPNNAESLFAVARAALNAHKLDLARQKAEAAGRLAPREGIFLLLADIEEADTGDQGRVRYWLAQALRAPRDPAWTADGFISEQWEPISPVTGKLDAFEWKVPVSQLGRTIEHDTPDAAFDKAAAGLPPIAAAMGASTAAGTLHEGPPVEADDVEREADTALTGEVIAPEPAGSGPVEDEPQQVDSNFTPAPETVTRGPAPGETEAPKPDAKVSNGAAAADAGETEVDSAEEAPILQETTASPQSPPVEEGGDHAGDTEDEAEREARFLEHRPDDPGVEEAEAPEDKQRFRLF